MNSPLYVLEATNLQMPQGKEGDFNIEEMSMSGTADAPEHGYEEGSFFRRKY